MNVCLFYVLFSALYTCILILIISFFGFEFFWYSIENSFHTFRIELFSSSSSSPPYYYYYSAPKSHLCSFLQYASSLIYGLNILILFSLSLTERYNPPLCLRSLSWWLSFLFYNGASHWAFRLTYWIFPCPLSFPSVFLCLYWIPLFYAVLNALFHSAVCSLGSHWTLLASSLISRHSHHLAFFWTLSVYPLSHTLVTIAVDVVIFGDLYWFFMLFAFCTGTHISEFKP